MASSINLFDSMDINLETKKKKFKAIAEIKQKYSQNKQQLEEVDDLLLFGYSCKLFRDDEVALKLENEANLIPWNGDSSLLIDRYDCRGYLFDLRPFDADLINKSKKSENINEEDIEIEKLCDEERYLELNKQLELDALNQEEELKRFYNEQHAYGAVDLKYSENLNKQNETKTIINIDNQPKLEAFTPSEKLSLPIGMLIPETKKHNTIIEKTASFVASKGLQMEILIKAKQSTNSQFDFLNYDHFLNPYYKHLVDIIKNNKYVPEIDDKSSSSDSNSDSDDDNYLHPLLSKNLKNVKQSESSKFKPNIKNSPYNDLIEKFNTYSAKFQKNQEEPSSNITIPNEEIKSVIDKLAQYVVKNGDAFEQCIKSKNEERFSFLNSESPYFNYYQYKLNEFKEIKNQTKDTNSHEKKDKSLTESNKSITKNSIISEYSNDDESDLESNSSNLVSPESKERFTKEQQAKRKLQATLFLNLIHTTSNDDKNLIKKNSKSSSNSSSKSRSRSRSRNHHRSKSRSSDYSRNKRKRNRRKYKSSKRDHTSSSSRSRSRSRSRKSKYRKKRSRSDSRHRHKHSKKGQSNHRRSYSRRSRSRSSRRNKHEDGHKNHKKYRKRRSKSRQLSKTKTDTTTTVNSTKTFNDVTNNQLEDQTITNETV